ncbi:uncharacterized protein LOC125314742 [Rhodamnia argentea]|uniref:Uncharacterized protein LOC125314742 n=1 Tax=Rhodamnia argentea TaxID=178133 RepID=A0ABM3HAL5_9MYRT|nr:uncharacterized protein LOC125314742 [Rhodamnia argentea]
MAGGINRRDDAPVPSSTNVFAALGSLKKKKKKKKSDEEASKEAGEQVFWAPAPLNAKSWANVDDGDDDDYATAAPPEHAWSRTDEPKAEESEAEASLEVGLIGLMYIGAVDV